jgi:hypothetical protein
MASLLNFLETYSSGIFVLFFCLAAVVFFIQWVSWIFCWGRFRPENVAATTGIRKPLRRVMGELFFNLVNDFRHLLALVIVLIFAMALGYAVFRAGTEVDNITKALQAVVATLGGLVGSLLGYYFGESAAKKAPGEIIRGGTGGEPEQAPTPAPQPPAPSESETKPGE